jgi:tripartite-type tricarboxylate transporter receptor subunit TctC
MAARLGHFDVAHIPYNGAAEVATALLRGDIDFQIGVLGAVLPMVRDGRLRALAVTGVSRLVLLPAVPTLAEAALPGFSIEPWGGLAIPVGAAPDAVATLDAALPRVLDASKVQAAMARLGLVAAYADAGSFKRQIAQELDGERQRARRLGITATP